MRNGSASTSASSAAAVEAACATSDDGSSHFFQCRPPRHLLLVVMVLASVVLSITSNFILLRSDYRRTTVDEAASPPSQLGAPLPADVETQETLIRWDADLKNDQTKVETRVGAFPLSTGFPLAHDAAIEASTQSKPTLIFHVGLPKTASTFLQCSLCSNANVTAPLLLQDDWVFLGTCPFNDCSLPELPPEFLMHRHGMFISWDDAEAWTEEREKMGPTLHTDHSRQRQAQAEVSPALLERLYDAVSKKQNALIIYEGATKFPEHHIRTLATVLNELFHVHIVVAYRRLFDFLPSKFNSVTRNKAGDLWPNQTRQRPNRPPKHGIAIPPFDLDGDGKFHEMVRDMEVVYQQHQTETVLRNYQRYFEDVSFIDLHHIDSSKDSESTVDPLLTYLVCRVMKAQHTCEATKADRIPPLADGTDNLSVDMNNDLIAVAAYEAGLIPETWRRDFVTQSIIVFRQEHGMPDLDDLPLKCFSEEKLNRLLELSIRLEKQLYGPNWKHEYEKQQRDGFAKSRAANKFCSADTDRILNGPKWLDFFAALDEQGPSLKWREFVKATEERIRNDKRRKQIMMQGTAIN